MTETSPSLPQPNFTSPTPVVTQPEPEKELYRWASPSRLYKKRNREFYTTIGAIIILTSIILLFAKEFLLIAVIVSFGFVSYVLASVKPDNITHLLTNKGIRTGEKFYPWTDMSRYWWEVKWQQDKIHLQLPNQFPGQLILLASSSQKAEIEPIVNRYLIKEKPQPTWVDNAGKWLQEKVPLETEEKNTFHKTKPPSP